MSKRSPTTKDVALLHQLFTGGQLTLAAEFQRNAVWPRPAKYYDLVVEELSGYTDQDIRDMFIRINKYVVQLSPQELRHAKGAGKFHDFVEKLGALDFWKQQKVFTTAGIRRMRSVEFAAELVILVVISLKRSRGVLPRWREP
jgi:hypothetical protein